MKSVDSSLVITAFYQHLIEQSAPVQEALQHAQKETLQKHPHPFFWASYLYTIDEDLRTHQTDILYETQLKDGSELSIYLLFEHKSYPEPEIALQLLRYFVRIWTRQRDGGERIQPIIPIVIYHGERVWRVQTDFQSLFPTLPAGLRPHVPQFEYLLRDFSHRSELELRGDAWLLTILMVLRAILSPTINQELPQVIAVMMRLLEQRHGLDFVRTILYYLSVGTSKVDRTVLQQSIEQHSSKDDNLMATLAQQWIQEGRQEGREEQSRAIARKLLPLMNDDQISAITGLTLDEVRALRTEPHTDS